MKSINNSLEVGPQSPGHILIDCDFQEFPFAERYTVGQRYGNKFPLQKDYVICGIMQHTKEYLVVPPEYANCTFGRKLPPQKCPPINHQNNPALDKILNGE